MSTIHSSSVEAARKALGTRLREIRRDAGLTGRVVSQRAGWNPSKTSRLENGVTPPSDADIRTWCELCEATDQAADLIAASRSTDSMYVEWRRVQRSGLRRLQEAVVPLFERTKVFRVYSSTLVPGLLQTASYATALLSDITQFRNTVNDVPEAVQARMARTDRVLYHGNHRFAFLIEESVLRYQVGDADTMAAQLGHLLTVMAMPSVSIGVLPFSSSRRMWAVETFSLFDDSQAQVELLSANVNLTGPSEVALYVKAFAHFGEQAVYGARVRALVTRALESLG